jgi:DNA polymerase elongation subunit (family B)
MVEHFANERFELKRLYKETLDSYYKDRDATAKVFLNSAYGITITNGLNYNSPAIGSKITAETRDVIDLALNWASGQGKDFWMKKFKDAIGEVEESEQEHFES